MFDTLKESWRKLRESPPGERFQARYRRRQAASDGPYSLRRAAYVLLGVVVMLAGLVMLFIPGPGWGAILLGLGLLGSEFRPVAVFLDRAEVRARVMGRWVMQRWHALPRVAQALLALVGMAASAGLIYLTYRVTLHGLG